MSKAPNKPRILPPVGTFPARVYRIIYLGTIKGEFKGTPTESYKVSISWELPTKTHVFKEGEPACLVIQWERSHHYVQSLRE